MSTTEELNNESLDALQRMFAPKVISAGRPESSEDILRKALECALEVLATPCPGGAECAHDRFFVRQLLRRVHV